MDRTWSLFEVKLEVSLFSHEAVHLAFILSTRPAGYSCPWQHTFILSPPSAFNFILTSQRKTLLVFAKGCARQALTSMKRDIVRIAWLVSLKASLHVYTEPFGDWTFSGFLARNAMMSWAVQSNPSNFCSQNWSLPLLSNSVCHSRKNMGIGNIKFMVRHYITHHTLFHLLGLCLCIFTVTCKTHYKASIWQRRRLKLIDIGQGKLMSWDTKSDLWTHSPQASHCTRQWLTVLTLTTVVVVCWGIYWHHNSHNSMRV